MNHMHPVVSVIVPVYNAAAFLRQTLDCICGQTLKEIEIILVDDGSSDETPAILQEYAARDSRIILLQQEHEYAGAARNKGMAIARGKYYSFLDADDIFEPTMLEKMVARAEEVGADVVICKADSFNTETGKHQHMRHQLKGYYPEGLNKKKFNVAEEMPQLLCAFQPWAWDKLFLADHVRKLNLSFGTTHRVNDILFVYPATAAAKVASIIDDEVLVHYRISTTQLSSAGAIMKDVMCMVDNARATHDKMKKVGIAGDIMTSFCCRIAGSLAWTVSRVRGNDRVILLEHIRKFEAEHNLMNSIKEASKKNEFREVLNDKNSMPLYQAINMPNTYKVTYSENSDKYDIYPVVSVVIPIYNVSTYLREALDSVISQSYHHLQIICVNDGSTDNSLEIIKEYAEKDARIVVLDGPNGGYGKAMNRGLEVANGKYMAIFEPDDVLPENAYATLIKLAEANKLDLVKGCGSRFRVERGKRVVFNTPKFNKNYCNRVITPRNDLQSFLIDMNTWTGLYKLEFLRDNEIVYNETPGASYQDNGMFFLSLAYANRVMYCNEEVYLCRRDNPNSSVHSLMNKPYAMRDEYAYIRKKLESTPDIWLKVKEIYLKKRYDNHHFTYQKLRESIKLEYLEDLRKEFMTLEDIPRTYLSANAKHDLGVILTSPLAYLMMQLMRAEPNFLQGVTSEPISPGNSTPQRRDNPPGEKSHPSQLQSTTAKESVAQMGFRFYKTKIYPHKKELRVLGIPVWSKNTKNGRCIHRVFGIRVRHKRLK